MNHISERSLNSVSPILKNIGPFNESSAVYDPVDALKALRLAKILVIGAGGLGCEILKNLALTGFKTIHIIDMDEIDVSNLNRQFLFRENDIGKSKAEVAAEFVKTRVGDDLLDIIPYYGKIQDKPVDYYRQFDIVICGLDNVEARRWINATLVSFVDEFLNNLIPLIDGGTEGFRGQSRVILPRVTSCYECTSDMITPKTSYPICTIASTPRLPEHCIEWASILEWPRCFKSKKFDASDPEQLEWMYQTALARAKDYDIKGVTKALTLGVVKNIIPAIASTNAIIAASCCNEAFKIITSTNAILDNYMMYSGDNSIFTYTYSHSAKPSCPVCGSFPETIEAKKWWTLSTLIEKIGEKQGFVMLPSLSTSSRYLYMQNPNNLEALTRPNLSKYLNTLVSHGEEIIVTDKKLPVLMRILINFTE